MRPFLFELSRPALRFPVSSVRGSLCAKPKAPRRVKTAMAPAILFLLLPLLFLLVSCYPHRYFVRDTGKATDQDYIARFHQRFSRIADPERSEDYAGVPRYDRLYMGSFAKRNLERIVSGANEEGWLAWGLSYHMMSLNQMFRVTGDGKYLWMNMSYILSVDTVRVRRANRYDHVPHPRFPLSDR